MKKQNGTIWFTEYPSPVGKLLLASNEQGVCRVATPTESWAEFQQALAKHFPGSSLVPGDAENAQLVRELTEYFAGRRQTFTTKLALDGTAFQLRVWQALQQIPYGLTCSYQELAKQVGSPKGCRAVGGANGANPVSILIPCHRVIAASGQLGGYGGGLEMKQYLLELEGITLR